MVSQRFVAQRVGGASALTNPGSSLGSQIRATLEAAKDEGRRALFEFRNGVHEDVLNFIERNAARIGAKYEIYR
jgi:hypothetical protein